MRLAGGSPQADLCTTREAPHRFLYGTREEAPADYHMYVCMYVEFRTEIHFKLRASPQAELCTTREAPHEQNYDQGGSPQAELRPGSLPTSRIVYDQGTGWLVGWLAGGITTREPVMRLAGWLAGWLGVLAGWLRPREAQRGPERPM